MEHDAARKGFALHQKPNQGNIGRSMNIGDLVRLTNDGVIAAWYPNLDQNDVGVVIRRAALEDLDNPARYSVEPATEIITVEWPRGRDTHLPQDLDIVRKHFS